MRKIVSSALILLFAGALAWPLIPSEMCEIKCSRKPCCKVATIKEQCPMMAEAENHAPFLLLSVPKPVSVKEGYFPNVLLTAENSMDPLGDFFFRHAEVTSSFREYLKIPLYFQHHSLLI